MKRRWVRKKNYFVLDTYNEDYNITSPYKKCLRQHKSGLPPVQVNNRHIDGIYIHKSNNAEAHGWANHLPKLLCTLLFARCIMLLSLHEIINTKLVIEVWCLIDPIHGESVMLGRAKSRFVMTMHLWFNCIMLSTFVSRSIREISSNFFTIKQFNLI